MLASFSCVLFMLATWRKKEEANIPFVTAASNETQILIQTLEETSQPLYFFR
jgi:hypothetical protein